MALAGGLSGSVTKRRFACNDRGLWRAIRKQPGFENYNDANGTLECDYGEAKFFDGVNTISGSSFQEMVRRAKVLANQDGTAVGSNFNAAAMNYPKIFIKDAYIEVEFFNGSNTPAYMDIYDLYPIRDWIQSLDAPSKLLEQGIADLVNVPVGSTPPQNIIGVRATQSIPFCERWHIFRRQSLYLAPGHRHIHKVHIGYNWSVNNDLYMDNVGAQQLILPRKKGYAMLMRLRGAVITSPEPATEATTSKCRVAFVAQLKIRWNYSLNMYPESHMETTLDTTPSVPQTITAAGSAVAGVQTVT